MADEPITERDKLRFDLLKHLTTLSIGASLFQLAIMERFKIPDSVFSYLALALFALSALCAFGGMMSMSEGAASTVRFPRTQLQYLRTVAMMLFFIGFLVCILTVLDSIAPKPPQQVGNVQQSIGP